MTQSKPAGISGAQLEAFRRDGVICLRNVVDKEKIERLRAAVDRDIASPGPRYYGYAGADGKGGFHGNQDLWLHDADFADHCLHSALPRLAGALLEANEVRLYFDHLFVKEPGAASPTPWHNDQPYWPIAGRQVVSFWLALDPVTADSGAVEYVRGSHMWDRWFQPRGFSDSKTGINSYTQNPDYEPVPDIDGARGDYDIVTFDMQPGDALAFHALTLHGAGGNATADRRRRGYAVRYVGDDVRYDPRPGTTALLLDDALSPGTALDLPRFPVVWRSVTAAAAA
jgi:ectoine hydroxylase-related dioxygenase (phytanoyl-CoA dioxygenase family)